MKGKSFRLLGAAVLAICVLVTACATPAPTATPVPATAVPSKATTVPTTAPPAKKLVFAVIGKGLDNPVWEQIHQAAVKTCETNNCEIRYYSPTQTNNLEEQNRLMDDVIAAGVDGILLCPVDSNGMAPATTRAMEKGIGVSLATTDIFNSDYVTFAGTANYEAMKEVTEAICKMLGGKGNVLVLEGNMGAQVGQDRSKGIKDGIAEFSGIKELARQDGNMARAKSMEIVENWLQTYPDVQAILTSNDQEAAGAIEALDAAGRLDKTLVSGFDGINDALLAIKAGRQTVTLIQNFDEMAEKCVLSLIDFKAGKRWDKRTVTSHTVVTKDNIDAILAAKGLKAP